MPPEKAQATADWLLRSHLFSNIISSQLDYQDTSLHITTSGLTFPTPIGLAAGYDKNCEILTGILALGFGYVVGGTVLPDPHTGNPKPRIIRQIREQALINSLGFPSKGMQVIKTNLEQTLSETNKHHKPIVISVTGINLEKFLECHKTIEPLADATELNISSPNTSGLRVFQELDTFKTLIEQINLTRTKPMFVKIPPYHDNYQKDKVLGIVRLTRELGVSGITAANTRPVDAPQLAMGQGGLSGRVLLEDTIRMVKEIRTEIGPSATINACGGISTTTDTLRALNAGANTVQLFTGLIYEGPAIVKNINLGIAKIIRDKGYNSLTELIASRTI